MDQYISTKEAAKIKKVGLCQHRIAELARRGEIVAHRAGKKKWLVKVTSINGKYELVKVMALGETQQGSQIEAFSKLSESEKATVIVRLAKQAEQAADAAGERYIDPFSGGLVI